MRLVSFCLLHTFYCLVCHSTLQRTNTKVFVKAWAARVDNLAFFFIQSLAWTLSKQNIGNKKGEVERIKQVGKGMKAIQST